MIKLRAIPLRLGREVAEWLVVTALTIGVLLWWTGVTNPKGTILIAIAGLVGIVRVAYLTCDTLALQLYETTGKEAE